MTRHAFPPLALAALLATGGGLAHAAEEVRQAAPFTPVSSSGPIDARALHADTVQASLAGVGSVSVYARSSLDASVSGIGALSYSGHPATVHRSGAGIGAVSGRD